MKTYNYSGKKSIAEFILTCIMAAVIVVVFAMTSFSIIQSAEETCIDILSESATQLAIQIKSDLDSNLKTLQMIKGIFEGASNPSRESMVHLFNSINTSDPLNDVIVLFPDGSILMNKDSGIDTEQLMLDFEAEKKIAPGLSSISIKSGNEKHRYIYQSLEIEHNGNVLAIVISLTNTDEFNDAFEIEMYDNSAQQFIIDGNSGNFFLDTLHNELGNKNDNTYQNKRAKSGFNKEKVASDIKNASPGYGVFHSETVGEYVYIFYAPIGIEKLSAAITLPESTALESAHNISRRVHLLLTFVFIMMSIYVAMKGYSAKKAIRHRDVQLKELKESHDSIQKQAITDTLTGLKNRSSYQKLIAELNAKSDMSFGCIYIDADALHSINNNFGHFAGDTMLKFIADALISVFTDDEIFRIGGDEFIVFCIDKDENTIKCRIADFTEIIDKSNYSVSIGFEYRNDFGNIEETVAQAEQKMYENKKVHYETKENISKIRTLNQHLENILLEKHDRDNFLSVISSYFLGVYIVDLTTDTARPIFQSQSITNSLENQNKFKSSLAHYIESYTAGAEQTLLNKLLDYDNVGETLEQIGYIDISYTANTGKNISLYICKTKDYCTERKETIWLFEEL